MLAVSVVHRSLSSPFCGWLRGRARGVGQREHATGGRRADTRRRVKPAACCCAHLLRERPHLLLQPRNLCLLPLHAVGQLQHRQDCSSQRQHAGIRALDVHALPTAHITLPGCCSRPHLCHLGLQQGATGTPRVKQVRIKVCRPRLHLHQRRLGERRAAGA